MGRSDLIGNGEECLVPYFRASNTPKLQHSQKNNNDFHHRISVKKAKKYKRK
jgi:hypothetical protein